MFHNYSIMQRLSSWKFALLLTGLGAAAGYAYYYFVGCSNGCTITSNPLYSSLYGSAFGFLSWQSLRKPQNKKKMMIQEYLQKHALIVDVRSEGEYAMGHVEGSQNLPLQQLPNRLSELQKLNKPIIFCCASGNRSGQATDFAKQQGLDCINGGGWASLNKVVLQQA